INISRIDSMSMSRLRAVLAQNMYHEEQSQPHYSVYSQGTSSSKVTLNFIHHDPPIWNEDTIFMGPKSAHMRTGVFGHPTDRYAEQLRDYYRGRDYYEAGVTPTSQLHEAIGIGGQTIELFPSIFRRNVYSNSSNSQKVRNIPIHLDVNAYIEGGNFLSNGASPGKRIFLLGTDALAYTTRMAAKPNDPHIYSQTVTHLSDQIGVKPGDKLLIVPQRTFHIDMSMTFTGENEIVLADSAKTHSILFPNEPPKSLTIDQTKLENLIQKKLENEGISVVRKPWSGARKTDFNLFNGEFVKSNDTQETYFLTNGIFDVPEFARREIEEDIIAFYRDRGIEVEFTPKRDASTYLQNGGGIGCLTNSLQS
uniref:hypothetical protein n=1 Tax=uncultured Tateyamaria sp. TaxID=455651 RepID=UPI0026168496